MSFFKKLWKALQNPRPLYFVLGALAGVAAIVCSLTFVFVGYTGFWSYVAYVSAAIWLAYAVYMTVRVAPKIKAWGKAALRRRTFTRNLTENYRFRTLAFATCSFVINLAFVLFNTVLAILTGQIWYASLAGYYFLLSVLRGGVFYGNKRATAQAGQDEKELRRLQIKHYGYCGGALLFLDIAMSVAVTQMVLSQKPTQYTEIMAIVFATYAFYKISLAIWNTLKARRSKDLQLQCFRNIGLVDGAVSLLSLQTTLVATFSESGESMLLLNALTGAAVCLLTVGVGIFMLIQARRLYGKRK